MLGHIMEWFYSGLAGIRPAPGSIGMKTIEIRPEPVGDVTYAKANYDSPYGMIVTDWKKTAANFALAVTIPANTTAVIYLPANANDRITESGKPIQQVNAVKFLGYKDGKAMFKAGSGTYHFIAQKK